MKKTKLFIFCSISIVLMIFLVVIFNFVFKKDDDKLLTKINNYSEDIGDYNNVSSIDAKLGDEDIKVTQSYLLNYTIKKGGTWYLSNGVVRSIKKISNECIINVSNEEQSLNLTIDSSKCSVKRNDKVNFVGTIDIETGNLLLSRISTDEINYSSAINLNLNELINNINLVRNSYFVINGYMVTDGDKYKLYNSKESYIDNPDVGNYFNLNWKDNFGYTGNSDVTVRCNILDTFKLHNCELIKK
ncbi:MAG: hypothetical protein IJZ46_05540 [Bacilli bacterium]|nr:hypothetical protein [Bacilli bacterium]